MATGTAEPKVSSSDISVASARALKEQLSAIIEAKRILDRPIDLIAYASDASFYRLIPKAVVQAECIAEIQGLFKFSQDHKIPLTFRAAGTSLSGQAISDGLLVELGHHWKQLQVEDRGGRVRVQPGVIGASVNQALRMYSSKMGPDPASISACMMGGILSNNSSGMCCGVEQNAYHTLASISFVLPSGVVIDSADPKADEMFHQREPRLAQGLLELKARIESSPLRERIRSKYRMKNTTGYSLNAFLDYQRAADIFAHLLIGSEGTLAFIAEAVLNTVPDLPVKYTGLLLFPDLYASAAAIVPLRDSGAKALEVMDRASLRSVEDQPGIPASLRKLPPDAAGLLVEYQTAREDDRHALEEQAGDAIRPLKLLETPLLTHAAAEQAMLWRIRAGMFPSVGSVRKSGTTVIIEDVAFPIPTLADAALDLNKLFAKHGYDSGIIFGHAKDGNLHFVITQGFNRQQEVDQYARFIDDVVKLVVNRYDGALKAEHGTGRNMAPFVETEWGSEAYQIMQRVKQLCDPAGLLNPGVIINSDPRAHLADLKRMPVVEEEVDKCIECGYCEPKCPSRALTLTPRQRIVVRREMVRLQQSGAQPQVLTGLEEEFPYMALDTCAVDGLCATACPVSIDTGQLTKRFRKLRASPHAHRLALLFANHFSLVEGTAWLGLAVAKAVEKIAGTGFVTAATRAARAVAGPGFPLWMAGMPKVAALPPKTKKTGAQAVYFPSCISRVMGHLPGEPEEMSAMQALVTVAGRALAPVYIPENLVGVCCGVPFSSKGFEDAHRAAANHAIEKFWEWSEHGRLPIVIDTSPCTYGLKTSRSILTPRNQQRFDQLSILDSIDYVHDTLLPKLRITQKADSVVLHPVCSVEKMGLSSKLENIAKACSDGVLVPANAGCCGFAGDRGLLFPELTESATRLEAQEVTAGEHDGYFSSSRTCEMGMTRATAQVYRSYIFLLEQASR